MKHYLTNVQTVWKYGEKDTPLDLFDSDHHENFISKSIGNKELSEEDLTFMISVSEHVDRPDDMLMFLGEYFKQHIIKTDKIYKGLTNTDSYKGPKELDSYFITAEILNSLATACKKFIEKPR